MKNSLVILFIAAFASFQSCKKDKKNEPVNLPEETSQTPQVAPDSIYYKNIVPDVEIYSIQGYTPHPSNCGNVQYPSDTLATYLLDLDSNNIADIYFEAKSFMQFYSASSPCVNYFYGTKASAINSVDSLGASIFWQPTPKILLAGDTINSSLIAFGNEVTIGGHLNPQYPSFMNFYGVKYLPFKRTMNNKTMYGWILVERTTNNRIIIKEYAINVTNNKQIICGQKN